jgi:hypothetical protein
VTVAGAALTMSKETLRYKKVQMIFRARHRNVQQAALFLDFHARGPPWRR